MAKQSRQHRDLSSSLMWTIFAPIYEITDKNRDEVVKWLEDKSAVLIWFSSIVTGSLVLLTLFGRKPEMDTPSGTMLSLALLCMFLSILLNLICVWQIPKWKFAIRTEQVTNGRRMTLDLEISSWLSIVSFLAGLVLAGIGNS